MVDVIPLQVAKQSLQWHSQELDEEQRRRQAMAAVVSSVTSSSSKQSLSDPSKEVGGSQPPSKTFVCLFVWMNDGTSFGFVCFFGLDFRYNQDRMRRVA